MYLLHCLKCRLECSGAHCGWEVICVPLVLPWSAVAKNMSYFRKDPYHTQVKPVRSVSRNSNKKKTGKCSTAGNHLTLRQAGVPVLSCPQMLIHGRNIV